MERAVTCVVQNPEQAEWIVGALHRLGFTTDTISVLLPNPLAKEREGDPDATPPQGIPGWAVPGGFFSGELGLLERFGALSLPGVGPVIAAGPLVQELTHAEEEPPSSVADALIDLGVTEAEAHRYEDEVKAGYIFISVDTDTRDERERAEEIFEAAHAEDILRITGAHVPERLSRPGSA